ncbi:MAG: nucleoside triphosphate pyrophosphohydrolase [Thermodesulfobacteriota bacterium]|nr:nucleoside triphosphate pyrophosphohydrolase [Thermodesulfobacteriota bacterium]|tara:strand:+ start:9398 stop:10138 length:741 start_codon:yes stop_codon:yes gene_type:complete
MNSLDKLIDITKKLRSEDGCPWDKKLTLKDLKSYILEEAYEIIDALEKNDKDNIKEEAGDLLLQIIFISNICEENKDFNFSDVILQLSDKLIRRHPHVFGNKIADTAEDAKEIWDYQKKSEKTKGKLNSDTPNIRAIKISKEYAQKGLEFSSSNDILNKLIEEINEFEVASNNKNFENMEDEIGDIIFTCLNLCRFNKINPDIALARSVKKFQNRSQKFFEILDKENIDTNKAWNKAKLITNESTK